MNHLRTQGDDLRGFLLNEPRGRVSQCVNLVPPSSHPDAGGRLCHHGKSEYYVPMSGSNTIYIVTALLETGMIPMQEPVTPLQPGSSLPAWSPSPPGLQPMASAAA